MRSEEEIREEITRLQNKSKPMFTGTGYKYVKKDKKQKQINYEKIKALKWVLNEEQK